MSSKSDWYSEMLGTVSEMQFSTMNSKSDWYCEILGTELRYYPRNESVPNWFHRKMQELCFGFKWKRVRP